MQFKLLFIILENCQLLNSLNENAIRSLESNVKGYVGSDNLLPESLTTAVVNELPTLTVSCTHPSQNLKVFVR